MPTKRRTFGSTASDYVPNENDGEIWIRRFKDPSTQIRLCPATRVNREGKKVYGTEAWWSAREHYDDGVGAFPCTEDDDCVGCKDPSERVNKRTRTYYVNALDARGELRVYKMGSTLFKTFQGREARMLSNDPDNLQPLSDRDYIINRMGKGLNTTYDPESGERYPVDFPDEVHDIEAIIAERYEQAERAYAGEEPAPTRTENATDTPRRRSEVQDDPPKRSGLRSTKPAAEAEESDNEPAEPDVLPENPTPEQIENAETAQIKQWLGRYEVEYARNAPRVRLVDLAKKLAEKAPFDRKETRD